MKKVLTVVLVLAVCMSCFNSFNVSAKDKDILMLVDTNREGLINKAGFTVEKNITNKTKYSASWIVGSTALRLIENAPEDLSDYDTMNFSIRYDGDEDVRVRLYFESGNYATECEDYYFYEFVVKAGQWNDISFKYSNLLKFGEPLGWNKIGRIRIYEDDLYYGAEDGSTFYIENMYLSGEPVQEDKAEIYPVSEEDKNKVFYYNDFNDENSLQKEGTIIEEQGNTIEHILNNKEGHLKISMNDFSSDCFFGADIKNTNISKFVVEMDVFEKYVLPIGALHYEDSVQRQGKLLLLDRISTYAPNMSPTVYKYYDIALDGYFGGKRIFIKDIWRWTHLGFLIDLEAGEVKLYVDNYEFKIKEDAESGAVKIDNTSNCINRVGLYLHGMNESDSRGLLIDNFAVYGGDRFKTTEEIMADYAAPEAEKSADISKIGDGVALMINKSDAYAKGAMTKVDAENENVVPVIVDSRTLVPVRFISESFDASVAWDDAARKVMVVAADKTIELIIDSNVMTVNGEAQTIDVPAAIMEERTMLPLRALVEALGKNVLWDTRGLIVITDKDITLDAEADAELSAMIIDMIEGNI